MADLVLDKSAVYVGFTSGKGFLARAIQAFSGGRCNHAFLIYWDARWNCWVEQGAVSGGFLAQYAGTPEPKLPGSTLRLWKPPTNLANGLALNAEHLGAPYDYPGLIGMVPVEIAQHAFHLRIGNPLEARKAMFCSEIVSRIIASEGIRLPFADGERFSTTDPVELDRAIEQSGQFECVYQRPEEKLEQPAPIPEADWDTNVEQNTDPNLRPPG